MVGLPQEGGCQCGALRYRITQPPLMIYNCHCTNCQKIGGGAFSTPATIPEAGFAFIAGEPRTIEWTSDAGNKRFAHGQTPSIGLLSVRSGTLDDTSWIEPVGDIWTRSAQSWVALSEGRLTIERQPTDYAPFIERFRAQERFPV